MVEIKKILDSTAEKITPSDKEYLQDLKFAESLIEKIQALKGKHVETRLAGSFARNTHLKNDADLDIFVLFPKKLSRKEFEKEGLRIGKKVFEKGKWEKAFSEHPYIRGEIQGYDVEIVPSYKVERASDLQSAVDRSTFHNSYLKKKLNRQKRREIRLLRQFLKGINCYGAELKTGSIPGFVVELLVLEYGSFKKVLKAASEWEKGMVIDVEKKLGKKKARKKFSNPLIVVDPTDSERNVAAALSLQQFSRFIAASRKFLQKPSEKFFFSPEEKKWPANKIKRLLEEKEFIGIRMPYPKNALADIVYGQLYRVGGKTRTQLGLAGFTVKRDEEWTDEKKECEMVFELEFLELEKVKKMQGPEVWDKENSRKFLDSHPKPVSGPRIEEGRWVLEVERKHNTAKSFLEAYVKKLAKQEKKPIKKALAKAKAMNEKEMLKLYRKNDGFARFLTHVLKGRERFLEW